MFELVRRHAPQLSRDRDLPVAGGRVLLRVGHATSSALQPRRGHRRRCSPAVIIGQLGITISPPGEVDLLPHVPVRRRLRRRPAVRARHRQGRRAAGALRGRASRVFCLAGRLSSSPSHRRLRRRARRRASTPARRRSRRRWASRPTRSTGSGCRPRRPRRMLDAMPVAYAMTYIFGTVGSAIDPRPPRPGAARHRSRGGVQALRGEVSAATKEAGGAGTAWHRFELRAYRVREDGKCRRHDRSRKRRRLVPDQRVFIERIRRGGEDHGRDRRHRDPGRRHRGGRGPRARCWST